MNPNATTWRNYLLAAALCAQVPHAAALFHRLAPPATGWWEVLAWVHAILYAIAIEGAVFYFVLQGKRWHSWGFALAGIATNVLYYWPEGSTQLYFARFALISVVLSVAIALYSHSATAPHSQVQSDAPADAPANAAPLAASEIVAPAPASTLLDVLVSDAPQRASARTSQRTPASTQQACEYCGERFDDWRKLNGHRSAHKRRGDTPRVITFKEHVG
jgi:hypothetical protein